MANYMIETRELPGMPDRYMVMGDGKIAKFVKDEWHIQKTYPWGNGYRAIKCRGKVYKVHHLVLLAFEGPMPKGMQVRHLNGDPSDNRIVNLCYGTPKENQRDRRRHGTDPSGERNGRAKLNWRSVGDIRQRASEGESYSSIARDFPVNKWMIGEIVNNRSWHQEAEAFS